MVQSIHAVLRDAFENAVREELILRNVAKPVQVSTPDYGTGKGLTVPQARFLLKATSADRLHALHVLALAMRMRRGELLGLHWSAIDLERGTLIVSNNRQRVDGVLQIGPTKTASSLRTLPLPPLVAAALRENQERRAQERRRLATGGRTRGSSSPAGWGPRSSRTACGEAGIRSVIGWGGLTLRFHDRRHTCVTLLLGLGVPPHIIVRQIAGHSDIGVTMKVYAHASLDEQRKALGSLSERLA